MYCHKLLMRTIVMILMTILMVGCSSPPATPQTTPDNMATDVAKVEAIDATLTARAPATTPTYTPTVMPSPTSTPTPVVYGIRDIMDIIKEKCDPKSKDWSLDEAVKIFTPLIPEDIMVYGYSQYDLLSYTGQVMCWYVDGYNNKLEKIFLYINLNGEPVLLKYSESYEPVK